MNGAIKNMNTLPDETFDDEYDCPEEAALFIRATEEICNKSMDILKKYLNYRN